MLYFFMKGRRIALRQEKIQHLPERSKEHELNWNACAQELHNNFIYHEIHDTVLPRAFGWASTTPKSSEGVLKSFTASTYLNYIMQKKKRQTLQVSSVLLTQEDAAGIRLCSEAWTKGSGAAAASRSTISVASQPPNAAPGPGLPYRSSFGW